MTLKEKFEEIKIVVEDRNLRLQYIDEKNNCINLCEKIADDFAIGFAEWITSEKSKYSILYGNQEKRFATFEEDYTPKELLEIYKKEKGL
jgi:hypothetical protein